MVSGYFGKYVDEAGMRITDMFLAFPAIILALAVEAIIGRGVINAAIAWLLFGGQHTQDSLEPKHLG
ncbi:hypothetical protein [Vulcanisaeta distributa]|uniref:hypothetical protein n=1 Tax=Vulcanisaeta distributa TaxID=164451 RepID=UPI000B2B144F|nr:hypothetical protein [Vulcanisaeta distributa]